MILERKDIKERLRSMPADIPVNHLELIAKGEIPDTLQRLLENGHIIIDPLPEEHRFSSCTVDLAFGNWVETRRIPFELRMIDGRETIRLTTYDYREEKKGIKPKLLETNRICEIREGGTHMKFHLSDHETFELPPNLLIVAPTRERVYVPNDLTMSIDGRSRFARKGIVVHFSAPLFHPGWCGAPAMEIMNGSPAAFNIYPGLEIASIRFEPLSRKTDMPYYADNTAIFRGQK